jgi:hypothetical protein
MAEDLGAVLLRISTAMAICLLGEDNFETCSLLANYHYTLRNIPLEHISHLLRGGSLKSRMG